MILYVNGDSHTAAAEAVNPHAFAEDDPRLGHLGRIPHPDNLAVSWGRSLASTLKYGFHCGAESASSNTRILRTTREWLANNPRQARDTLMIIQWTTWEREEWLDEATGTYYQVNGSGIDVVPQAWQERYRQYILGLNWHDKTQEAHDQIWNFHNELDDQGVQHIFFNGNNTFESIQNRHDWGNNYLGPYDTAKTFDYLIKSNGYNTVNPDSWHFGKDGHSFFHRFMLQYIIDNKLM